jgi:predicted ABC-type ATPase
MPTCWIIAGPNGSGKTTFALEYLPKVVACNNFVNADLIAAGTTLS